MVAYVIVSAPISILPSIATQVNSELVRLNDEQSFGTVCCPSISRRKLFLQIYDWIAKGGCAITLLESSCLRYSALGICSHDQFRDQNLKFETPPLALNCCTKSRCSKMKRAMPIELTAARDCQQSHSSLGAGGPKDSLPAPNGGGTFPPFGRFFYRFCGRVDAA